LKNTAGEAEGLYLKKTQKPETVQRRKNNKKQKPPKRLREPLVS
jgi:hypothetical protein